MGIKKIYFIGCLLFFLGLYLPQNYLAQTKSVEITGYVYDKTTGQPLESANVIVSGTKWGTSTEKDGFFRITSIPAGNYELLVSMVGYTNESRTINTEEGDVLKLKFQLNSSTYQLKDIEVTASHPKEWAENLKLFKKFFLGQTGLADDCKIENEYILNFTWNGDTLNAQANEPLIIENRALGYKVKCYLNKFFWIRSESRHYYDINSFFSDLIPKDEKEKKKWEHNRDLTYTGSLEHFLYSLVNGNYIREGFEIFSDVFQPTKDGSTSRSERISGNRLISKSDIFNSQYVLHFSNYLKVKYESRVSWLRLQDSEILLDAWGYPSTIRSFVKMGYWGDFGIADMLPKYYMNEIH